MIFKPKYITFDCYGTLTNFRIHDMPRQLYGDQLSGERLQQFVKDFSAYRLDEVIVSVDLPSGVDPLTGAVGRRDRRRRDRHVRRLRARSRADPRRRPLRAHRGGRHRARRHLDDPELHLLEAADVGANWPVPGPEPARTPRGSWGSPPGRPASRGPRCWPPALLCRPKRASCATPVRSPTWCGRTGRRWWPPVRWNTGRVQAWVVGPGIGTGASGRDVLAGILEDGHPVCADADSVAA